MALAFLSRWLGEAQEAEQKRQETHATRKKEYGRLIRAAAERDLTTAEESRLKTLTDALNIDAATLENHVGIVQSYTAAKAKAEGLDDQLAQRKAASDAINVHRAERERIERELRDKTNTLDAQFNYAHNRVEAARASQAYMAELVAQNPDLLKD